MALTTMCTQNMHKVTSMIRLNNYNDFNIGDNYHNIGFPNHMANEINLKGSEEYAVDSLAY